MAHLFEGVCEQLKFAGVAFVGDEFQRGQHDVAHQAPVAAGRIAAAVVDQGIQLCLEVRVIHPPFSRACQ